MLVASVRPVYGKLNKTLASKLSFVSQQVADSTQSKSPFGGRKYLKTLQAQGKLKEDGELFLVLELLAVRKLEVTETRVKLEEYVTRVCQEEEGYAHPLTIVAIARLAARMSQSQSSDVQHKLIKIFASLYPEASGLWLYEAEAKLMDKPAGQAAVGSIVSSSLSVEDKWESLKGQYGCRSEGWKIY
ncbi:hypothetical protein V7S43_009456 [Phytophthora oleae]|uniref:TROVE domain-containing protein n=1 Tax=Phytophthora oleae TaxID=2107226 RepID=A0ABD3FHT4_9STRA